MENENYPIFNVNDSDELIMQKLLNSTLVKELRKSKEENIKLKHEKEILNLKIEKLEEENKTLKNNFSTVKNPNPHKETMEIVENILQSNDEIKDEPSEIYDLTQKYSNCESCGNTFSREEDLESHKCEYCEIKQVFDNGHGIPIKQEIKQDIQTEPINEAKKVQEKTNRDALKRSGDIVNFIGNGTVEDPRRVHELNVDNNEDKNAQKNNFKCDICSSLFSFRNNLYRHKKREHNKNVKCKTCSEKFSRIKDLKKHIKIDHEDQKKKQFKCQFCDYISFTSSNHKRHIQTIHEKTQNFKCKSCGKDFALKHNLKRHETTHE